MVEPLLEGLLPTTGVIGFVERPLDDVVDPVCAVLATIGGIPASALEREPVGGPLATALERLRPLSTRPAHDVHLLCPTDGDWTALFDSAATGGDPRPLAIRLPDLLNCRTLVVQAVPARDRGGSTARIAFSLAAPGRAGWADAVRAVSVSREEDRPKVTAYGEPLACEAGTEPADLDLEALDRCLRSLGVRAFDASAYFPPGSAGVLIRR